MSITLGLEEELQVIDQKTRALSRAPLGLKKEWTNKNLGIASEIHCAALEIQTPVCKEPLDAIKYLAAGRLYLHQKLSEAQKDIAVSAVHPFALWQEQEINACPQEFPHYYKLLAGSTEISPKAR